MCHPLSAFLLVTMICAAQSLPVVDLSRSEAPLLHEQCARLLGPASPDAVSASARDALRKLLKHPESMTAVELQKLLDPFCLVAVNINPESRVKVARGPAAARLVLGHDTFVLVKVHNEAGVTAPLRVSGVDVRGPDDASTGCWLEAAIVAAKPFAPRLLGQKLEYVVLRLRPHEAGKREATLRFDAGQGSQDLGFRAELPVLFTITPAK